MSKTEEDKDKEREDKLRRKKFETKKPDKEKPGKSSFLKSLFKALLPGDDDAALHGDSAAPPNLKAFKDDLPPFKGFKEAIENLDDRNIEGTLEWNNDKKIWAEPSSQSRKITQIGLLIQSEESDGDYLQLPPSHGRGNGKLRVYPKATLEKAEGFDPSIIGKEAKIIYDTNTREADSCELSVRIQRVGTL